MSEMNHRDLLDACERSGVILGAYDRRVIRWAASFDPSTSVALAGLILRAHADGWMAAMKAAGEDGPAAGESP